MCVEKHQLAKGTECTWTQRCEKMECCVLEPVVDVVMISSGVHVLSVDPINATYRKAGVCRRVHIKDFVMERLAWII